jgi:hypothetical protein
MSSPTFQTLGLDALPPAAREAFLAIQAKVAGFEAHTERQDDLPTRAPVLNPGAGKTKTGYLWALRCLAPWA